MNLEPFFSSNDTIMFMTPEVQVENSAPLAISLNGQ
jgi:hypothetical protein